jgi:hypothetical protein
VNRAISESYADHAARMLALGYVMTSLGGLSYGYACTTCHALVAEAQTVQHQAWHKRAESAS